MLGDGHAAAGAESQGRDFEAGGGLFALVFIPIHFPADIRDRRGVKPSRHNRRLGQMLLDISF